MSLITIKNLSYSKGERSILKNVSIDFAAGAITSILGPTGCGKTTLLRMISGLEVPQHGKIIIGDKTASDLKKVQLEKNLTIIWVMHDHKLAMDHSHFITVINNGTVEAYGTKETKEGIIKSNNPFIKEFIKY